MTRTTQLPTGRPPGRQPTPPREPRLEAVAELQLRLRALLAGCESLREARAAALDPRTSRRLLRDLPGVLWGTDLATDLVTARLRQLLAQCATLGDALDLAIQDSTSALLLRDLWAR